MAGTKFRAPNLTLVFTLLLCYCLPPGQHPIPNVTLHHPDCFVASRAVKPGVSSALFAMLGVHLG